MRHETPGTRDPGDAGFVLPAVILTLVAIGALAAAGFMMTRTNFEVSLNQRTAVEAGNIAERGMARYLSEHQRPGGDAVYQFGDDTARVTLTRLLAIDSTVGDTMLRLTSVGIRTLADGGTAQRTVSQNILWGGASKTFNGAATGGGEIDLQCTGEGDDDDDDGGSECAGAGDDDDGGDDDEGGDDEGGDDGGLAAAFYTASLPARGPSVGPTAPAPALLSSTGAAAALQSSQGPTLTGQDACVGGTDVAGGTVQSGGWVDRGNQRVYGSPAVDSSHASGIAALQTTGIDSATWAGLRSEEDITPDVVITNNAEWPDFDTISSNRWPVIVFQADDGQFDDPQANYAGRGTIIARDGFTVERPDFTWDGLILAGDSVRLAAQDIVVEGAVMGGLNRYLGRTVGRIRIEALGTRVQYNSCHANTASRATFRRFAVEPGTWSESF